MLKKIIFFKLINPSPDGSGILFLRLPAFERPEALKKDRAQAGSRLLNKE